MASYTVGGRPVLDCPSGFTDVTVQLVVMDNEEANGDGRLYSVPALRGLGPIAPLHRCFHFMAPEDRVPTIVIWWSGLQWTSAVITETQCTFFFLCCSWSPRTGSPLVASGGQLLSNEMPVRRSVPREIPPCTGGAQHAVG